MTPEQAKAQVMDLYNTVAHVVGGNWEPAGEWGPCWGRDSAGKEAYFDFGASRVKAPLQADADTVANQVRDVMIELGYQVRVQHDPNLTPLRTVIGYPGGYLQGSEPDGFGFQFTIDQNGFADFSMSGHCVAGDDYYLNTGKHL